MAVNLTSKAQLDLIVKGFKKVLEQEAVQNFLRRMLEKAPALVLAWLATHLKDLKDRPAQTWARPNYHFGQKKLRRRVNKLSASISTVYGDGDGPGRADLVAAVGQIETALSVAQRLPLAKRVRANFRIDSALDEMERALFESTLPNLAGGHYE